MERVRPERLVNRVFGYGTASFSSFEAAQTLHHIQAFADLHPHSQNLYLEVLSGYLTLIKKCTSFAENLSPQFPLQNGLPAGFLLLPRREPLQGTGLQEGVTQSICRATDTISAYINHISTARPPGAC